MRLLIRPKTAATHKPIRVEPFRVTVPYRQMRVLDFDIENRPLSYLGSDFTTAEVTAIAWAWVDEPDVTVYLLGEHELPFILSEFVAAYQQADMVTGHYVRGHDLPMLNGALIDNRMPLLPQKLVQDTKLDLIKSKGISLSQESLGAMFRLEQPKVHMNQGKWRAANRLTPEGLAEVRQRVIGDVRQHIALLKELRAHGYLSPPVLWKSCGAPSEAYVP